MISLPPSSLFSVRDRVAITVGALAVLLGVLAAYYVLAVRPDQARAQGEQYGTAIAVAASASQAVTATVAAATDGVVKTQAAIDKTQAQGAQHERARLQLDQFFKHLTLEALHDAPDPVDACVLPADRLRRWAAANAGPAGTAAPTEQGSALGEPDPAPSGAASTPVGGDAGSGSGSPGGSGGFPPGGGATVQPPETHGDRAP